MKMVFAVAHGAYGFRCIADQPNQICERRERQVAGDLGFHPLQSYWSYCQNEACCQACCWKSDEKDWKVLHLFGVALNALI